MQEILFYSLIRSLHCSHVYQPQHKMNQQRSSFCISAWPLGSHGTTLQIMQLIEMGKQQFWYLLPLAKKKKKIVLLIIVPLSYIAGYLYPFPASHCSAEGVATEPVSLLELPYFALWIFISGSNKCVFAQTAGLVVLLPCAGQHPALLPVCQLWLCQLLTLLQPVL